MPRSVHYTKLTRRRGTEDEDYRSAQITIKPRGCGVQYILRNIDTPDWAPNRRRLPLLSIYVPSLQLSACLSEHFDRCWSPSFRAGGPRVYCYLYSGNYQFAGIHYGIRGGFDDLEASAFRRNTRVVSRRVAPTRITSATSAQSRSPASYFRSALAYVERPAKRAINGDFVNCPPAGSCDGNDDGGFIRRGRVRNLARRSCPSELFRASRSYRNYVIYS